MKKLLIGMTVGAIVGALAFKKMEDKKLPDRVIDTAREKLCGENSCGCGSGE